jgi:hypothetical protein
VLAKILILILHIGVFKIESILWSSEGIIGHHGLASFLIVPGMSQTRKSSALFFALRTESTLKSALFHPLEADSQVGLEFSLNSKLTEGHKVKMSQRKINNQ